VRDFRIRLSAGQCWTLHQGSPHQVAEMLLAGEADVGIATEALVSYDGLIASPCLPLDPQRPSSCRRATRCRRRAADARAPGALSGHHLRRRLHRAAAHRRGVQRGRRRSTLVLTRDGRGRHQDVRRGSGLGDVGIVASIAYDESPRARGLSAIDAGHLFAVNLTRLAIRRGTFLRGYVYDFIETFASPLKREVVVKALASVPGTRFES
jgi:LysR family cys regulon transcriptional activator